MEKATSSRPQYGEAPTDAAESKTLCMRRHPKRENREILWVSAGQRGKFAAGRNGQKTSRTVLLT